MTPPAGWQLCDENAFGLNPNAKPKLARYPGAVPCALAVSNDTDSLTGASYRDLHDFVNGSGETAYGPGLGLEMGDSFWVWSYAGYLSLHHASPFSRQRAVPSTDRELIVEHARLGWLDSLHSFGAWLEPRALGREQVRRALDEMAQVGVRPSIYVNHGGVHNAHNVGGPWGYYQRGDVPGDASYCLDLLREAGFRYFWNDNCFEIEKFGEHRQFRSQAELDAAVAAHDFGRHFRRRVWPPGEERVQEAFGPLEEAERVELRRRLFNRLLIPMPAADGDPVYFFKRYRGREAPNAGNFALQVNATTLDDLEAAKAAVIVYQHFGVWRAIGSGKRHPSRRNQTPPLLDAHAVWSFKELAARKAAGRVFVTTTSRLLDYHWVRDHLVYRSYRDGENLVIHLRHIDCPVRGRTAIERSQLQGITFELPPGHHDIHLRLDGQRTPPPTERHPHPSKPEHSILTIPWTPLQYPTKSRERPVGPKRREQLGRLAALWHDVDGSDLDPQAVTYARRAHQRPLAYYVSRVSKLGLTGRRALDAGCGTGTWSFALRARFDRVVGVDVNESRLAVARSLAARAGLTGVRFDPGDVRSLDFSDGSFDAVVCYGVLISTLELAPVLGELRRVLRPEGTLYVCLNALGWSLYLRDVRGESDRRAEDLGRGGVYNTVMARDIAPLLPDLSRILAPDGEEPRAADPLADLWDRAPVAVADRLTQALDVIAGECGTDYLARAERELRAVMGSAGSAPRRVSGGRAYNPEEVLAACEEVGLSAVQWAPEGALGDKAVPVQPLHPRECQGRLAVWEFMARRPAQEPTSSAS